MGKSLRKSNFRRLASFCSAIESFWADEDALHMVHHYRAKGVSNCFDVESIFDCLLIVTDSSVLLYNLGLGKPSLIKKSTLRHMIPATPIDP